MFRSLFTPEEETIDPQDAWHQQQWVWVLLYYVTLALSTAVAWQDGVPVYVLGLSAFSAVWQTAVFVAQYRGRPPRQYPVFMLIHQSVGVIAWYGMLFAHPGFYFHLFSLFAQINQTLIRPWGYLFNIVLAVSAAVPQYLADGLTLGTFLLVGLVGGGSTLLSVWIHNIIEQSGRRRDLIHQLQETQAQLATAERRAGTLEERARLAREIHDTLAQDFISIIMHLEAGEQLQPSAPEKAHRHLAQAQETAREGLVQARRVVQDLRPDLLDRMRLPEAIERVVARWSQHSGVRAHTAVTGPHYHLHPQVETTLLRAVQEALTNVQKHATADEVRVTLSYMGDLLMLDVQDDGAGFEPGTGQVNGDGGYGLQAMAQRVREVQGELTIESEPGDGTTLTVQVPVETAVLSIGEQP